ncbi:MAG: H-NS histone family protein [Hyphomicrobium sp.]|nr:H-NS histone family protein [Hyphomicrobium sp.]
MAAVNIERMTLKQLSDLEDKIARAKSQAQENAKADLKAKIDRLIASTDFTVAELYGFSTRRGRSKSAAKYANPDDRNQTWTGRGRKPNWLVARLKKGAKLEDFSI